LNSAYYNEIDPFAAQWLRNLIEANLIAPGEVDERSIEDVRPDDLRGFTQCHFFAGIGGWSYALRLAGWPDDEPVWTGSCPCQPFSVAGFQNGFSDKRHLWPEFKRLISERNPPVIFGEQVAAASQWLGRVRGDLEEMDYAVGAVPIEAASDGACHYRDRYWFVAHDDKQLARKGIQRGGEFSGTSGDSKDSHGLISHRFQPGLEGHTGYGDKEYQQRRFNQESNRSVAKDGVFALEHAPSFGWGEGWTEDEFRGRGFTASVASLQGSQFVECSDGTWRRLPPPRVRWLGNAIPSRVAKLRALGNAIVPQVAQVFIESYLAI